VTRLDWVKGERLKMLLREPPPTQADLHFRVFGFPIRVHPFFWLVTLLMGMGGGSTPPVEMLIWVVAVFVSILVHELGHALVQRHFGGRPWITLYGFGGMAACDDCERSTRSQILISLAGPAAGFLLAIASIVVLNSMGRPDKSYDLFSLLFYLKWINVVWGGLNLLPIYPLDGGQVSRELCQMIHPRRGIIWSLKLSMLTAGLMIVVAIRFGEFFPALFFGYLAYSSFQTLEAYRHSR
jgi:stage IV sporulation protein FB